MRRFEPAVRTGRIYEYTAQVLRVLLRRSPSRLAPIIRWIHGRLDPDIGTLSYGTGVSGPSGSELTGVRGLRDSLKPGWRSMLEEPSRTLPEIDSGRWALEHAALDNVERLLHACGWTQMRGDVLEVGPHLGIRAAALASRGHRVVGIDDPRYYLAGATSAHPDLQELADVRDWLDSAREAVIRSCSVLHAVDELHIEFRHEDFLRTRVEDQSMDLVVSWEVLEHVADPDKAFEQVARVLRPGGYTYHEYNPFFCVTGGHSLGTTDVPFSHARLDREMFRAFVDHVRPDEATQDMAFLDQALNRTTIEQMESAAVAAGLEILAMVALPTLSDLRFVSSETLEEVRWLYPTARLEDLIARTVWLVARKA